MTNLDINPKSSLPRPDSPVPEVTSSILPYFQAVNANLGGGYRVGIYASRNICTRVAEAGCSAASFVSDMSTGFSGNLGFQFQTTGHSTNSTKSVATTAGGISIE
ncbi:DUF1906 domain-containing protein [Gleimia hominis]|uniref:DUF1906 domain-containing protein n=1 Tax=Gleimia hominis TaxID=595468 RepID=A0ABU3I826_9ACTO|nr:glycoside hydrolase domain-containing protein [Gleimia hominis]MDT3766532.1 DUF1906 domain-containing protein [Gleimia hominis]